MSFSWVLAGFLSMGLSAQAVEQLPGKIVPVILKCDIPKNLHSTSAGYLELYLKGEMLNTAFLRGFSWPNSDYIALGECIIKAYGRPNDPIWEKNLQF